MKTKLTMVILLLVITVLQTSAQASEIKIIPKAKIEYNFNTPNHAIRVPVSIHEGQPLVETNLGNVQTGIGIEFQYKKLALLFDNVTYMQAHDKLSFLPIQTNFVFRLQVLPFRSTTTKLYIEHECAHPFDLQNFKDRDKYLGYTGAYTKIGLSFNY